jgi:hypothetical protein
MTATLPAQLADDTVPNLVGVAIEARDRNWSNGRILTEITKLLAESAPTGTPVIDSAENAWIECGSANLGDFGHLHSYEIEQAARVLMQQALIEAWARRGRLVLLVDQATFFSMPDMDGEPTRDEYQAAWQEAANSIDRDALLAATDLTHEYEAHHQD